MAKSGLLIWIWQRVWNPSGNFGARSRFAACCEAVCDILPYASVFYPFGNGGLSDRGKGASLQPDFEKKEPQYHASLFHFFCAVSDNGSILRGGLEKCSVGNRQGTSLGNGMSGRGIGFLVFTGAVFWRTSFYRNFYKSGRLEK